MGARFSRSQHRLHIFPRLTDCMLSRAYHHLLVFARWTLVACFPALYTDCMFCRTCYRLSKCFPVLKIRATTCFPALNTGCMFYLKWKAKVKRKTPRATILRKEGFHGCYSLPSSFLSFECVTVRKVPLKVCRTMPYKPDRKLKQSLDYFGEKKTFTEKLVWNNKHFNIQEAKKSKSL